MGVVALAWLRSPAAAAEERQLERPTTVRVGLDVYMTGIISPTNGYVALAASHQLSESVALEFTGGAGVGNARPTGLQLGALVRYLFPWIRGGAHNVGVSAGPSLAYGADYGPVGFARLELDYELRTPRGFTLLAGVGAQVTLNTSLDPAGCQFICTGPFRQGTVGPVLRLLAGYAF